MVEGECLELDSRSYLECLLGERRLGERLDKDLWNGDCPVLVGDLKGDRLLDDLLLGDLREGLCLLGECLSERLEDEDLPVGDRLEEYPLL